MSKLAGLVCLGAMAALSAPRGLKSQGMQAVTPRWNLGSAEQTRALKLKGDPKRGAEAYLLCVGCHQHDGAGQADGVFPRLAGQHAQVVIKQLSDIRLGRRDVPIMYPFASTIGGPQELADLAAYLEGLTPEAPNGRGPGHDPQLGAVLYTRDCAQCHGVQGEGRAAQFFPRLVGQHYKYVLRQELEIRTGTRRNANPEMTRIIRHYTPGELEAVADHVSRLQRPAAVEASR
jgi:cytochrome c553